MLTHDARNLLETIALRYQKLIREKQLLPAYEDSELLERLIEANEVQPLNLPAMSRADDLDLVIDIGELVLHCEAHHMKDDFRSRYAL